MANKKKHAKSRKKSTPAKRGTQNKGKAKSAPERRSLMESLGSARVRAISGVVCLAMAVFSFLCIYTTSATGIVGRGVDNAFAWLLGIARFAAPIGFLILTVLCFVRKRPERFAFFAIGATLCGLAVLGLFSIPHSAESAFTYGELSSGGGFFGALIAWPFRALFGEIGAYIASVVLFAVGGIIAFGEQIEERVLPAMRARRLSERIEDPEPVPEEKDAPPAPNARKAQRAVKAARAGSTEARVYPSSPKPAVLVKEEAGGQYVMDIPKQKTGRYRLPPATVLNRSTVKNFSRQSTEERKLAIERTLQSMDVDAQVRKVSPGPTVSLYEVEVGTGEKVKRVTELEQDIAYSLGSPDIRIYSPIPGRQAIGIEVPNHVRDSVTLGDIFGALEKPQAHNLLTMVIGKNMSGEPVVLDLAQLPHLLLAGSTGAGKSSCMNSLICALLLRCRPDQLNFIMIDPKFVEFAVYNGLPHLLCPVINEPEPAAKALTWAVEEMDKRYKVLQKQAVVHIDEYNAIADSDPELESLSKIVIVIDELADLMIVAKKDIESSISRLTAKARAVGIHLIIATQRPSVDVITGVIKNNITARVAFQVASNVDSKTILGQKGAEKLLGKGDMLLDPGNIPQPERVQGALIQTKEIKLIAEYIKEQGFEQVRSINLQEVGESVRTGLADADPLLMEAAEFVVYAGEASASMFQTQFRVGYARARRILGELSQLGMVGPSEGSKPRKVLINPDEYDEWKERQEAG